MKLLIPRSSPYWVWLTTLAAYGISQVIILAGSVVRIPLITQALGESGYGLFVVVTSMWPAVQILANGLAGSARILVAKYPTGASPYVNALRRTGWREFFALAVVAAVALPLLSRWVEGSVVAAMACVIAGTAVVLPLAAHQGVLEGYGHTAASHLALATSTLVGLPVLVLALSARQDLTTIVAASVIGFVSPYVTYRLLTKRFNALPRSTSALEEPSDVGGLAHGGLTGAMTGWALANVLVFVLDPFILAVTNEPSAAGQYGLALRITGLVTIVPVALGGLLTVWFERLRLAGDPGLVRRRLKQSTVVFAVLGGILAGLLIGAGPWAAAGLSGGAVGAPRDLYFWMGLYGGLVCLTSPLLSAWAAPHAASLRARVGVLIGVINVGLSFVLAPLLGVVGPIVATLICNVFIASYLAIRTVLDPGLVMAAERAPSDRS